MPRRRAPWTALLALVGVAVVPAGAAAYEDQLTLGIESGVGVVVIPETELPCCGPLLGLSSSIGIGDTWAIKAHLAYAWHPSSGPDLHVAILGAELLYLLDVAQVVPFFGAGLDGLGTLHDGDLGLELGAHLTVGADYLLSRTTMIGLDFRAHFLPLSIEVERLEPVYLTLNARFSLAFDL